MVIVYREFDGADGLALEDDMLVLYCEGRNMAHTTIGPSDTLRQMMLEYQVPSLFPGFEFCLTEPHSFEAQVTLSPVGLSGEIMGLVTIDDEEHLWVAQYRKHPDFRRSSEVPQGMRPWAGDEEGAGWEFLLPASIQTHPDILVPKRLALLLEAFVEDIADGKDLPIPYRRKFDNIFSAENPAWRVNLPRIISVEERGQLDLV